MASLNNNHTQASAMVQDITVNDTGSLLDQQYEDLVKETEVSLEGAIREWLKTDKQGNEVQGDEESAPVGQSLANMSRMELADYYKQEIISVFIPRILCRIKKESSGKSRLSKFKSEFTRSYHGAEEGTILCTESRWVLATGLIFSAFGFALLCKSIRWLIRNQLHIHSAYTGGGLTCGLVGVSLLFLGKNSTGKQVAISFFIVILVTYVKILFKGVP